MTKNIEIDLEAIPHPKDCYRVPEGAAIPAGTPFWLTTGEDRLTWVANGYSEDFKTQKFSTPRLTAEPIATHPTPEDSPIIINRCQLRGAPGAKPSGLAVQTVPNKWVLVDDDGCDWWLHASEITDWSPAIVTKTGHGIWDERDKRDRVDVGGDTWRWLNMTATWATDGTPCRCFGSLAAMKQVYGEGYLTGFADEKGSEE